MIERIVFAEYFTKIGRIVLFIHEQKLCFISLPNMSVDAGKMFFKKHFTNVDFVEDSKDKLLNEIFEQVQKYFLGVKNNFEIPIKLIGTEFQKNIWRIINEIPYGHTRSYADIAREIQNRGAIRAVGAACGANPIPIIVPCHRVIGSNGQITGYIGGVELKNFLLELESPTQKLL